MRVLAGTLAVRSSGMAGDRPHGTPSSEIKACSSAGAAVTANLRVRAIAAGGSSGAVSKLQAIAENR